MAASDLTDEEQRRIADAVEHYERNVDKCERIAKQVLLLFQADPALSKLIHFIKYRVKETESLRNKLERLARSDQGNPIDADSVFEQVRDIVGIRIVHLHTDQIGDLHPRIREILEEEEYKLITEPEAHCWDVDYEELFNRIGLKVRWRKSMYTTVHYDFLAHQRSGIACELQVRSLADEMWAEVSHRVNYPTESPSNASKDQLKVLARLTSGCGRLVDSIFKTHGNAMSADQP